MKRTQQTVLLAGLLTLSLAACSYMPWRNTSGTTPATSPSSGSHNGASDTATDPGPNAAANSSGGEKSAGGAGGMTK